MIAIFRKRRAGKGLRLYIFNSSFSSSEVISSKKKKKKQWGDESRGEKRYPFHSPIYPWRALLSDSRKDFWILAGTAKDGDAATTCVIQCNNNIIMYRPDSCVRCMKQAMPSRAVVAVWCTHALLRQACTLDSLRRIMPFASNAVPQCDSVQTILATQLTLVT